MGNGFMLIPILVKFIVLFYSLMYVNSSFIITILSECAVILSICLNKLLTDNATCEEKKQENKFSFTKFISIILRGIWFSGATYGVYKLFVNIPHMVSSIPIPPFMLAEMGVFALDKTLRLGLSMALGERASVFIPIFLTWVIAYSIVYSIGNSIDQNDLPSLCNPETIKPAIYLPPITGLLAIIYYNNNLPKSQVDFIKAQLKILKNKPKIPINPKKADETGVADEEETGVADEA